MHKKKLIGITGGVGAGKSSVLNILRTDYHARIILADEVAHMLMEPGSEGLSQVTKALGTGFLLADGSVDKKALAELMFHDKKVLDTINRIVHPLVWAAIKKEAAQAQEALIVIEAAIFDTAPEGYFDEIWYVDTNRENRIRRLMERRGYTREKCESIMSEQDTEEEYRRMCQRVLDNNHGREEMKAQLREILDHEIC